MTNMQQQPSISLLDLIDPPAIPSQSHPVISLFDVVRLVEPLPQLGLTGTVVEILGEDAYEVEFCDEKGATYAEMGFRGDQLIPIYHAPPLSGENNRVRAS